MKRRAPKDPSLSSRVHSIVVFSQIELTDDETTLLAKILQAAQNGWPLTRHEAAQLDLIEQRGRDAARQPDDGRNVVSG